MASAGLGRILLAVALAGIGRAALAADQPAFVIAFKTAEVVATEGVKEVATLGLGAMTGGAGPIAVKLVDFAIAIGDAGVKAQDRTLDAQMVAVGELGEQLRAMHRAGIDTRTGRAAVEVKEKLRALQASMQTDNSGVDDLFHAVSRNRAYALSRAGLGLAFGEGIGRLTKAFGLHAFIARIPMGVPLKQLLSREPGAKALNQAAWQAIDARATLSRTVAGDFVEQTANAALDKFVEGKIDDLEQGVRDQLYQMALADHPSRPATYDNRLDFARLALVAPVRAAAASAVAQPTIILTAPQVARPLASAGPAPGSAYEDPRRVRAVAAADPLAVVLQAEDLWVRPRYQPQVRTYEPPPPPPPAPPEPPQPTARERQRRHEWDCAGAGVKAGCDWPPGGSWDGAKGQGLGG